MNSCTKTPETSEQINPIHNHSTLLRSHPRPNTRTLSRAMTAVRNAFSFIPDCVGDAAGAGPWVEKAISDDRRLAMGTAPFPDPKKIVDPLVKASQCEPCSIVCTERGGTDCCCNIPSLTMSAVSSTFRAHDGMHSKKSAISLSLKLLLLLCQPRLARNQFPVRNSVRPIHLFDRNFDHDSYFELPCEGERDAQSLRR